MNHSLVADDAIDFDPFSAEFHDDPQAVYRRLRDDAPVYHSARYGFWALSRYADVVPGMKDFGTFSSGRGVTLEQVLAPEPPEQRIPMSTPGCASWSARSSRRARSPGSSP